MQIHPDDMNEQVVASVQPDLVILVEDNFEALAPTVTAWLRDLQHKGKVITVAAILGASVPLEMLGNILGVNLEPYQKGNA